MASKVVTPRQSDMADPQKLKKVQLYPKTKNSSGPASPSSSINSSKTHSPKWPHPGGGGLGERAWTKEVVHCRSHGPPPFIQPMPVRDHFPKRKEWEAQFPQPDIDLHCEFHGNATQAYIQKELRRCSRTRPSIATNVPSNSLEEFLKEQKQKTERSLSNQKVRDRKTLRIIHQLEKENVEKKQTESMKDEKRMPPRVVQRPRKALKGIKNNKLLENRLFNRLKNSKVDVDTLDLSIIDQEEFDRIDKSKLHVKLADEHDAREIDRRDLKKEPSGHDARDTDQRNLKKDPSGQDLQTVGGKPLPDKRDGAPLQPTVGNIEKALSQPAKLEDNAFTTNLNDSEESFERLDRNIEASPIAPSNKVGQRSPSFNEPCRWISLPRNLGPAPPHIEDPPLAHFRPPRLERGPKLAATVPLILLSPPKMLGYHDTYVMQSRPIRVG